MKSCNLPDWFSSISSKAFASSVQSNATLLDWSVLMSYSSEYLTRKEVNHNLGTQELKKTKDLISGSYNALKGKFLVNINPQANRWFINWSHSGIRMRHNFYFNIYIWSYCVWDRKCLEIVPYTKFSFLISINGKNKQTEKKTNEQKIQYFLYYKYLIFLVQINKILEKNGSFGLQFSPICCRA